MPCIRDLEGSRVNTTRKFLKWARQHTACQNLSLFFCAGSFLLVHIDPILGILFLSVSIQKCHVPIGERAGSRPSCLHSTLLWNFPIVPGCFIPSKVRTQHPCAQAGVKHKIFQSVYECLALFGKQVCICTIWCDSARITVVRKCWIATFDVRKRACFRLRVQTFALHLISSSFVLAPIIGDGFLEIRSFTRYKTCIKTDRRSPIKIKEDAHYTKNKQTIQIIKHCVLVASSVHSTWSHGCGASRSAAGWRCSATSAQAFSLGVAHSRGKRLPMQKWDDRATPEITGSCSRLSARASRSEAEIQISNVYFCRVESGCAWNVKTALATTNSASEPVQKEMWPQLGSVTA